MDSNAIAINWGLLAAGESFIMLFLLSAYLLTTKTKTK
jgi:hypothetical protein